MATDYTQYLANRKLNIAEQKQRSIQKAHDQAVLAEQQRQAQLQKEVEEKNTLERVGETALDFFGTLIGKGLGGLVEGVVDAGAAIGGFTGGLFGADTGWAEDFISFNATEEWIGKPLDNATKGSYMNDTFVEDVVEGVGQMLPTIGLMVAAPFTGGATLAGVPYTVGATVASAGGKGVEEALDEDAEFNQAFGYGLINAGIEGLIEYATAGMGKGITSLKPAGKGLVKTTAKSVGKTMIEEAASEAIEEGLTEFLNPLAKGVTYKDFDEEMKRYGDAQLYKDTGYAALVGGTVGGITAGAGGIARRVSAGGKSGYSIQQSVSEISTLDKKSDNLFNRGKIDAESIQTIRNQQQAELNNISTQLKQMTSEQRIKTINEYNLNKQFNESGDIISNTQTNSKNKPLISAETNIEAYTPSLVNADLRLAPTTKELSEASKSAKKTISTLNGNQKMVITDSSSFEGKKFDGFVDSDGVVYINNNSKATDIMRAVALHEVTHTTEGTKEYNNYKKYLKDNISKENLVSQVKKVFGDVDSSEITKLSREELWNVLINSKIDQYSEVNQSMKKGEAGKYVAVHEAETELIAEFTGDIFNNEDSIKRIVNHNSNLAVKIYEWLKEAVAKLTKKGYTNSEEYKFLRKAEKLYADALKNSKGGFSLSEYSDNVKKILNKNNKEGGEIVNGTKSEARYSLLDNIVDNSKRESQNLDKEIATWEEFRNKSKESGVDTKRMDSILEDMYAKRRDYGLQENQWNISKDAEEFIRQLQDGTEQLETKESRSKYEQILKKSNSFKEVSISDLSVNIIHKNIYAKILKDIDSENASMGISTEFYIDNPTRYGKETNIGGFFDVGSNKIYLPINNDFYDFVEVNRHERIHFLSKLTDFEAIENYKDKVLESLTQQENETLYAKYSSLYPFLKSKAALFEEVAAQIYNGSEELSNLKAQDSAREELNNAIKNRFGLSEVRFSLKQNEVDSSGKKLSEGQKKFFKDSKVRDENGNLQVVYHGTDSEFTIFDKNAPKSELTINPINKLGFFFTPDVEYSKMYSSNGKGFEVYLNVKNPHETTFDALSKKFNLDEIAKSGFDKSVISGIENKIIDWKSILETKNDGVFILNNDGQIREIVAFHSNQIKNIDNTSPTLNEDVRFSLENDKTIKDLVVVHNINNSQLLDAINLGGLVVPSIAVTKTDSGFTNFGETSLIFKSDTIDPLKDRRNKVFESDVYSKTFPRTVKRITDENINKIYNIFKKNAEPYGLTRDTFDNALKERSISEAVDSLRSDLSVRVTYLESKGIKIEPVYKKLQNTYHIDEDVYNKFIKDNSETLEKYYDLSYDEVMEYHQEVSKMVNDAFVKYIEDKYSKKALPIAEYGYADVRRFLEQARKIMYKGDQPIYDRNATYDKIRDAIKDTNDLDQWIKDTISPYYEEGQYFRNNKDPFTPSGNRRSFDQLYEKVTLSSILDYMTGTVQDAEGFDYGVGNLRSLLAKQFKTINEIKKSKNKIVTHEEMEVLKKQTEDSYWAIISEITENSGYSSYSASDAAANVLKEIAKTSATKENIVNKMQQKKFQTPSDELVQDIQQFLRLLKNYQTEYFEAKPQRIVGFDEVVAVVAPVDTDAKILDYFNEKGILVKLYGENTTIRSEHIKSLPEDIRFSLKENEVDSSGKKLSEGQRKFFKDSKVRDENGNLIPAYHGTDTEFNVFERKEIGKNFSLSGNERIGGFYFTNSKSYADYYGRNGRVGEYYLNITNPYILNAHSDWFNGADYFDINSHTHLENAIENKHDGIIVKHKHGDLYVAFHSNQIKNIDNTSPTLNEDIRFSLSDGEGDYKYSKGQISKYIAEHSKPKSYAKVDAEKVINTIVNNTLTFGDKYGEIANKTKKQVVDMFWHSLNTRDEGYRAKAVLDIADYLIENSVAESIYKGDVDSESASYIINNLRPYLRKIDLTSLKGEIAHKYDTDKSVYARWGKRKGTQGMGVDTIAQDLIDSGIQINATTDADIFFEIDQMYRDSLAQLKSKTKESLLKVGSAEEISQLRQTIARELLNAWDDVGKKTKFQTTIDKYTGRISTLKNALKEVKAANKITNQIIDIAREARDIVKRNYKESAGVLKDDRVKAMMKIVSGFNRANSTIIASDIRNKISQLSSVYTQNNLGQFSTDTESGAINSDFDQNIRDAIDFLMNNKSTTLTAEELNALRIVSKGILHLYKNYDKMTYQGKLQEVSAVAESGMGVIERTAKMKSKNGVFSKMFGSFNKKFLINATDPLTAVTSMEGYDSNGVVTQSMVKVMEGDTNAQVAYTELMMPFEEFYKNNKKYRKRLNELVSINTDKGEIKITVNEAATLYGWAQREQSNIYTEGFKVTSKDGSSETYFITPTDIDNLYDSLTNADKNFIEIARKMFNEQARDMKVKTDEQLKGYSVIEETNWYIPIKRDQSQIATELGSVKGYIQDFATADNMSFNKATVRGARGALRLQNMTSLVESHARGVSTYYGLAVPLKNFNKVWNKRIDVEGKLVSIKEVVHDKIWSGANEYLGKFFNDLQGVRKGGQNRLLNKMRGSYAKFQLAFNVGTVLKQTASFAMAYTYLDMSSLARGLAIKTDTEAMFKYAPITKARMFDKSVVKAQGLIDNLGTASDTMTKPIQLMDNAVVYKLWNASQVQVEKDMGYKIGTEQNLVEAGKLLEKVVRETQSNSITSERSAMSRSDSFLISSFTMFMSDAQKQFSRLYESVGRVNSLKWRIKNGEAGLQQEYKQARKKLNRSLTGVTMSALIVAMVNKFMRWLLAREDKDNFWEGLGSDMMGQFLGLLPIVRDFYGYLADDYEINNYALGMINDSADAIKGIWTVSEKLISGQYVAEHEINKPVRNLLYTFGQFTGIPFRNMYNLYYGAVDKFSPSEALKLKSLFYGNNGYSAALKDAVDKGDLRNADKIVALMLEDKTGKVRDDNVIETTRYLVSQGYNPIPKSLNKKITYNNEEINLTARQHAEFSKIYEQSNDVIKSMVNSSRFERLDDSAKARAMKMVYDYYYNLGLENLIGESLDNKTMLFASGISIDQLAMAIAQAQTYEADVNRIGNVISGSKKQKIQQFINRLRLTAAQKYMIMGYLGYSNKNGASTVNSYINRLKLSKAEKQELYLMSGYKQ